jgi:protein-disulfide isomerase
MRNEPRTHLLSALTLVVVSSAVGAQTDAPPIPTSCDAPAATAATAPDQHVVGKVGKNTITEAQIVERDQKDFAYVDSSYALKVRQLQMAHAEERYALLKQQTDRLLDQRALALEAESRHTGTDAILADIKVKAVTDQEAHAYYEANKERTTQTYEQLQAEITQYLANQHNTEATRKFYDGLRAKHGVVPLLEPYRVTVAATGPVKGKDSARITVVEFADFQCPFCRQAEKTVSTILEKHPNDVRVVFRQLPLASVHPNATIAAKVSVCADHQGKFWPMHDAMYGDQTALSEPALIETAKRLGLDSDALSACIKDPATTTSIETDLRAADELNIQSTPYFLVNGRPIKGSVSVEQFDAIVAEELRLNAGNRG